MENIYSWWSNLQCYTAAFTLVQDLIKKSETGDSGCACASPLEQASGNNVAWSVLFLAEKSGQWLWLSYTRVDTLVALLDEYHPAASRERHSKVKAAEEKVISLNDGTNWFYVLNNITLLYAKHSSCAPCRVLSCLGPYIIRNEVDLSGAKSDDDGETANEEFAETVHTSLEQRHIQCILLIKKK